VSDLFSKIQEGRNFLEELAGKIPGFSGYQERSNRREADKLLREAITERYETQWARVNQLQRELIEQGGIEHLDRLDSAAIKLRTFIDRVKTASYGYSGFFDAVKVNEKELAALYEYDQNLLDGATGIAAAVDNVESSMGTDGLAASIRHLIELAREANENFDKRGEVLTGIA